MVSRILYGAQPKSPHLKQKSQSLFSFQAIFRFAIEPIGKSGTSSLFAVPPQPTVIGELQTSSVDSWGETRALKRFKRGSSF
ncbi:hypothetical protein CEXT_299401 [Caerostris extrusa]|uniref:Uncharacterized protein n=1 Tax=Caerostris extrusa TaxID=172846 RepID=A0AAV4ND15_CAEEX|nr:hypothetical protein CEXT_299401 [Caerostris extrusa]